MEQKKRTLLQKLRDKYRLIIRNETTFDDRISITLTPLNVVLLSSSLFILAVILFLALIAYTPVKEYLPGYKNESDFQRTYRSMLLRLDSIEKVNDQKSRFIDSLRGILMDDTGSVGSSAEFKSNLLRLFQNPEMITLSSQPKGRIKDAGVLLPPLNGYITRGFMPEIDHYAVDIVAEPETPVRATRDGTVILASWTADAGHVIALQHANDLVSIYKHNSVLLKKKGNFVDAGEAIAITGNSGEYTTGQHLHFELWQSGLPADASKLITFRN